MTSGTAAQARYTGPKRRQCEPRRLSAFQYVYCARLVSAVSVMAKLRLCEKAFAPADAVTPSNPASRSGQHQLPTARARHAFFSYLVRNFKRQMSGYRLPTAGLHDNYPPSPLQRPASTKHL